MDQLAKMLPCGLKHLNLTSSCALVPEDMRSICQKCGQVEKLEIKFKQDEPLDPDEGEEVPLELPSLKCLQVNIAFDSAIPMAYWVLRNLSLPVSCNIGLLMPSEPIWEHEIDVRYIVPFNSRASQMFIRAEALSVCIPTQPDMQVHQWGIKVEASKVVRDDSETRACIKDVRELEASTVAARASDESKVRFSLSEIGVLSPFGPCLKSVTIMMDPYSYEYDDGSPVFCEWDADADD
jgi:hypothetical protein